MTAAKRGLATTALDQNGVRRGHTIYRERDVHGRWRTAEASGNANISQVESRISRTHVARAFWRAGLATRSELAAQVSSNETFVSRNAWRAAFSCKSSSSSSQGAGDSGDGQHGGSGGGSFRDTSISFPESSSSSAGENPASAGDYSSTGKSGQRYSASSSSGSNAKDNIEDRASSAKRAALFEVAELQRLVIPSIQCTKLGPHAPVDMLAERIVPAIAVCKNGGWGVSPEESASPFESAWEEEESKVVTTNTLTSETPLDRFVCNSSKPMPLVSLASRGHKKDGRIRPTRAVVTRRDNLAADSNKRGTIVDLTHLRARIADKLMTMHEPKLCDQYEVDMSSRGFLGEGRQGVVRIGHKIDGASTGKSSAAIRKKAEKGLPPEVLADIDNLYAIKTCNKFQKYFRKEDVGSVRHEVRVLRRLEPHQHLLRFVESFESPINIHIVAEYCTGGDLFSFLNCHDFSRQCEPDAAKAVRDILSVLQHIHSQGVAHLDIKLENIMLRRPAATLDIADLVLVDFGHSRDLPTKPAVTPPLGSTLATGRLRRPVGSPSYAAPEVVLESQFSARSDIWSLGVITYVLLQGYLPFPHLQTKQWRDFKATDYTASQNSPFRFQDDWCDLTPAASDFVRRCLTVDPDRRLSVERALAHPWIVEQAALAAEYGSSCKPKKEKSGGILSRFFS